MTLPDSADDIESIGVIGAGLMGRGIGLTYALSDREVTVFDIDEEALGEARSRVRDVSRTLARNGIVTEREAQSARDRLDYTTDFGDAVAGTDFVTEAVTEDVDVKREVFARLDDEAPDAILATNTSGLSIADVTSPLADPSCALGTHWFNPPYIVPLVEVVKGPDTDDALASVTYDLLADTGKTPVTVERDIPGFIGNRIQAAMSYEAFSLLARGVASAEDIDRAVKAGFGFRLPVMGIFEKMDQSGLDVHHEVEKQLMGELDRGTDPNPVIEELLEEGHTGLETGKGIYDWTGVDPEAVTRKRDDALLSLLEIYRAQESYPIEHYYEGTGRDE